MNTRNTPVSSTVSSAKEPWLAVTLSAILPGVGLLYAGQIFWGLVFLLGHLALVGFAFWLLLSADGSIWTAILLLLLTFVVSIASLIASHAKAKAANNPAFEGDRKRHKDPWLAVFLAKILPGLGHFYLGQWLPGILVLVGAGLISLLFANVFVNAFVGALVAGAIAYYTYVSAPVRREHSKVTISVICFLTVLTTILSASMAFGVRSLLAEARYIPSEAMVPTLQINDRVIVEKFSYQFDVPHRGDIIVFNPPEQLLQTNSELKTALIKRIIGLPTEKIEVKDQKVYVNDQPLDEPYIQSPPDYQWGPEVVPAESFFVLGDNRNNSFDSHFWGYVPRQNIIGRANKIFWPPDRAGSLQIKSAKP